MAALAATRSIGCAILAPGRDLPGPAIAFSLKDAMTASGSSSSASQLPTSATDHSEGPADGILITRGLPKAALFVGCCWLRLLNIRLLGYSESV